MDAAEIEGDGRIEGKPMMDQTLPARIAASLAAALSSRSATIEAANETTNETGKDQKTKKTGAEIAVRRTGKTYGLILKGGNPFVAGAGVTGASAAKLDNPSDVANLSPNGRRASVRCSERFSPSARSLQPR
jgi:uncharacterized membrane protein